MNAELSEKRKNLSAYLKYIFSHPLNVYILLFFKPLVDMFYSVALFDYLILAYAIILLGYTVVKRPLILKNLKFIDYLTLVVVFLMFLAFFRNTSGFRIFVKTASQFLLFFIGRFCTEDVKPCIKVLKVSSTIVILANFICFVTGLFNGAGFKLWGNALTFCGLYYFKTDLSIAILQSMVFILMSDKLKWYDYALTGVSLVMIFMSNARIGFVIAFMLFGLIVLKNTEHRFKKNIKVFDYRLILTEIACAALSLLVMTSLAKTPLYEKLGFISAKLDPDTTQNSDAMLDINSSGTASGSETHHDSNIFKRIIGRVYTSSNTQGRSEIWNMLCRDFTSRSAASQIFGIDFVSDQYEIQPGFFPNAHNSYLKTMYSIGILGLALFVTFMIYLIYEFGRVKNRTLFYVTVQLVCILVISCVSNNSIEYTQFTWLTMFFVGMLFGKSEESCSDSTESCEKKEEKIISDSAEAEK